jgi:hypothetical protein
MEDIKETVVQLQYYQDSLWRAVDQVQNQYLGNPR